ncbi:MarR family winged helix-turn-helix transcriptional regulator [Ferrimonas aestuarii]|uniref:Winged helix-turn-helix transcriptional regulator n=1 Tax=Ferrimonas aestuarii TaxID=2569539 RepID=A0A4U1BQ28_9GAMM|nr:MarR family winged helix-turn-helix transcriptional regulator [Ferrimonas aestuarii]TKB56244.1 winged helix-turn-helix transcriptional regulator [Ferrimonas aestuarii]
MEDKSTVSITGVAELDASPMFLMGLAYKQFRAELGSLPGGKHSISLEMFGALRVLSQHGQISQQQLADYLLRNRSVAKRLVDNGIKLELIEASKSLENKKTKLLSLTPLGEQVVANCAPLVAAGKDHFLTQLSDDEQQQLSRLMQKLVRSDVLVD